MMQREVANRILSRPGGSERGALSVVLQRQFLVERVTDAPASAFMPPPKVDSTVLRLTPRSDAVADETWLYRLIHFGFTQRRKTLVNSFMGSLRAERAEIEAWLEQAEIPEMARAQELTEAHWVRLAELIPPR